MSVFKSTENKFIEKCLEHHNLAPSNKQSEYIFLIVHKK